MERSSRSTSVGELESHSAVIGQGGSQVSLEQRNCIRLNYSRPERNCHKGNLQTVLFIPLLSRTWGTSRPKYSLL